MCDSILKIEKDENKVAENTKEKVQVQKNAQGETIYYSNEECEEFDETLENENAECECDGECDGNCECDSDYQYEKNSVFIAYDLEEEQNIEKHQFEYHKNKSSGDWHYSKMIVSHSYQNKNNTEFFFDHLDKLFQKNGDCMNNVISVYYKNDLDIDIVYEFAPGPGIHLLDNLRIPAYKPDGIIFSNAEDTNKWSFRIIVLTKKGIYSANRYINEDVIGCY